jgi:hypothetical protein
MVLKLKTQVLLVLTWIGKLTPLIKYLVVDQLFWWFQQKNNKYIYYSNFHLFEFSNNVKSINSLTLDTVFRESFRRMSTYYRDMK